MVLLGLQARECARAGEACAALDADVTRRTRERLADVGCSGAVDARQTGRAVDDQPCVVHRRSVARGVAVRHDVRIARLAGAGRHAVRGHADRTRSRTVADRRRGLRAEAVAVDARCRDSVAGDLRIGRDAARDRADGVFAADLSIAGHGALRDLVCRAAVAVPVALIALAVVGESSRREHCRECQCDCDLLHGVTPFTVVV